MLNSINVKNAVQLKGRAVQVVSTRNLTGEHRDVALHSALCQLDMVSLYLAQPLGSMQCPLVAAA